MTDRGETRTRPNVLFILTDQQRYDALSFAGNPDVRTPNIDRLANDGVVYTNSFCAFPVCTPSRYSIMTGLYPHQHLGQTNRSTIQPGLDTFAGIARSAGYRTQAVGKMHFTPTYLDLGFDEMLLAEQDGPGRHDDDYHRYLRSRGLVDRTDLMDLVPEFRRDASEEYWNRFGAIASSLPEEEYSTRWIGDQVLAKLDTWGDDPSLLMVGFIKPHHPFDVPSPWSERYDPDQLTLLPGWMDRCLERDLERERGYFPHDLLTEEALRNVIARYYGSIEQIDLQIGRMVELLKRKNLYDRTLIIFTSDHGEYLGYHHLLLKNNFMYEPLVRVPLVVKYPDQRSAAEVEARMVSNVDIAPTILSIAGCELGPEMRGENLHSAQGNREFVFAEHSLIGRPRTHEYMVRSTAYKLLLCEDPRQSLFFDLRRDPIEVTNLFSDGAHQKTIAQHIDALKDWILFETASLAYCDKNASQIDGANVPKVGDGHAEESASYFRNAFG